MAEPTASTSQGLTKLVIRNVGLMLSGAMENPILDADALVAENGRITALGRLKDLDTEGASTVIDAKGTTLAPGLVNFITGIYRCYIIHFLPFPPLLFSC